MNCFLFFILPAALCASIRQAVHNATHGHHDPVAAFQHHLHLETEKLWQHMDFNLDGNFGRDDLQHFIHDYDTNHDGEVTKAEFKTHWTHDDPSLCMVADGLFTEFDSNMDGFVDDKDLTASYNKVDINKDGHVEKHEFKQYWSEIKSKMMFFLAVLFVCYTTCASQTTNSVDAQLAQFRALVAQEVNVLFTRADTNHNHRFDVEDMNSIFTDYDKDHNNQVCETEWVSQFTHNAPGLNLVAKGLFLELDMDRSGCITHRDLQLYYNKIDTNDDNHVDEAEFKAYFTEVLTILYVIAIETSRTTTALPLVS